MWWTDRRDKLATAALLKNYCTRRKINKTIGLLKKEKRIPRNFLTRSGIARYYPNYRWIQDAQYYPNYRWIQNVFLENGLHVYWEMRLYNEKWWRGSAEEKEKIEQDEKEYLAKMLREIILCDYQKTNFQRKDRNEEAIRKGRRGEEEHSYWPSTEYHVCIEDLERSGEIGGWRSAFWPV